MCSVWPKIGVGFFFRSHANSFNFKNRDDAECQVKNSIKKNTGRLQDFCKHSRVSCATGHVCRRFSRFTSPGLSGSGLLYSILKSRFNSFTLALDPGHVFTFIMFWI